MVAKRAQLDKEQVRANILSRGQNKASLHDAMSSSLPERANPPLAARQRRRVDLELECLRYVGCCCLE